MTTTRRRIPILLAVIAGVTALVAIAAGAFLLTASQDDDDAAPDTEPQATETTTAGDADKHDGEAAASSSTAPPAASSADPKGGNDASSGSGDDDATTNTTARDTTSSGGGGTPQPGGGDNRRIVYATQGGVDLELDVFYPKLEGSSTPGIILVHGGGWRIPGRTDMARIARALRDDLQMPVFNIEYRTDVRPSGFPAEVDDIDAAVEWVRANGSRWNVDPDRIALVGSSSGGNISLVSALRATGPLTSGSRVAAVVALSPPVDLAPLAEPGVLDRRQAQDYLGCEPAECPDLYRDASIPGYASSDDPAVFIANSLNEQIPVDQAVTLARALVEADVTTEVVLLEGDGHGHALADDVNEQAVGFLQRALDVPGAPPAPAPPDIEALEAQAADAALLPDKPGSGNTGSSVPATGTDDGATVPTVEGATPDASTDKPGGSGDDDSRNMLIAIVAAGAALIALLAGVAAVFIATRRKPGEDDDVDAGDLGDHPVVDQPSDELISPRS